MSIAKNVALVALGAVGAVFAVNQLGKPAPKESLASVLRREKKEYNKTVHPEQERTDTLFDRTAIMEDVKSRKPWNKSYAEKERAHHEES